MAAPYLAVGSEQSEIYACMTMDATEMPIALQLVRELYRQL